MVLAEGSEHASVSMVDSSLSGLNKSPASNHSPSSCLLSGYSTPPDKSVPTVGENPLNQYTLPNKVLPGDKRQNTNTIEAFNGNNFSSDNLSIYVKVSGQANQGSSRNVVTHLKRLPKKTGSKEAYSQHCSLDATVVNGLLESIMKSCIQDSEESFEERNSILSKLKVNVELCGELPE